MNDNINLDIFAPRPEGVLISVDTGQAFKVEPTQWPLDESITDEEPTPMKFTKEVTFKISKSEQRKLKKFFNRKPKFPRKMKKVFKHIKMESPIDVVEKGKFERQIIGTIYFHTVNGYPYTKWVRKVIRKAHSRIREELKKEILPPVNL